MARLEPNPPVSNANMSIHRRTVSASFSSLEVRSGEHGCKGQGERMPGIAHVQALVRAPGWVRLAGEYTTEVLVAVAREAPSTGLSATDGRRAQREDPHAGGRFAQSAYAKPVGRQHHVVSHEDGERRQAAGDDQAPCP